MGIEEKSEWNEQGTKGYTYIYIDIQYIDIP